VSRTVFRCAKLDQTHFAMGQKKFFLKNLDIFDSLLSPRSLTTDMGHKQCWI
jgi:hypothetical protein